MIDVSLSKEVMNFNTKVQKESNNKEVTSDVKVENKRDIPKESFKDTFNKVKEEPKAKNNPTSPTDEGKVESKDSFKELVNTLKENNVGNENGEFLIEEIENFLNDESIDLENLLGETITLDNKEVDVEDVLNQLATLINNLFISQEINKEIKIQLPVDNGLVIDGSANNQVMEGSLLNTEINEVINGNDKKMNFNEVLDTLQKVEISNVASDIKKASLGDKNIKNIFSQIINALNTEEISSVLNAEEVSLAKEALSMIFGQAIDKDTTKLENGSITDKLSTLILKDDMEANNATKVLPNKEGTLSDTSNNEPKTNDMLKNISSNGNQEDNDFSIVDKAADNKEDKILSKILSGDNGTDKLSAMQDRLSIKNNFDVSEPSVVHKTTVVKDIIKNISFMSKNAIQELKVKIYPKELGEMTIKILSEEGILKAEIKATSKETYNLLNSNLNELKKTLSDQNIKIQEVNIGLYQEDATFFSGENKKEFERNNANPSKGNSKIDEATIEVEENNAYVDNSLNMLA